MPLTALHRIMWLHRMRCRSGGALKNDTHGPWGWQAKVRGLSASKHLPLLRLGRKHWAQFAGVLCGGWADLYHVPVGLAGIRYFVAPSNPAGRASRC
jgi:hypothetical protein